MPRYPVQRHLDEAPPDSVGKAHVAVAEVSQREDPEEGVVCVVVTSDGRDRIALASAGCRRRLRFNCRRHRCHRRRLRRR